MMTRAKFTAASGKPLNARRAISLRMDAKNGLFYSTSSGKTQDVAELIKEKLGDAVEGPFEPDEVRFSAFRCLFLLSIFDRSHGPFAYNKHCILRCKDHCMLASV